MSKYIDINNEIYPEKLKKIKNPPKRIYYEGNLELLNEKGISIIGTRNITEYGKKFTKEFTKEIALRDIIVISGLAHGVDSIAHSETLKVKGKTVAVLGSGLKNIYPQENIKLYEDIIKNGGLVITEFEDEKNVESSNFPKRNRIVSALAECVLVIEAAYRSGTSITANFAWEQGKKVYALPRKIR